MGVALSSRLILRVATSPEIGSMRAQSVAGVFMKEGGGGGVADDVSAPAVCGRLLTYHHPADAIRWTPRYDVSTGWMLGE